MERKEQRLWIFVAAFSLLVLTGLSILALHIKSPTEPLKKARVRPMQTSLSEPPVSPSQQHPNDRFDSPFGEAIDRLNHAFKDHPAMTVEEIISKVNESAPVGSEQPCPLAWHDNETTLSVRSDQLDKLSPTTAIQTCAEAIERLR